MNEYPFSSVEIIAPGDDGCALFKGDEPDPEQTVSWVGR